MNSSMLHRLAVLALTLMVALPIAPRDLMVLCFGADGHVALESASDVCRNDTDAHGDPGEAFCSDGCGPCTDVQLIADSGTSGRPSNGVSVLDPSSTVAVPSWSVCNPFNDRSRLAPAAPHPGSLGGISPRALVALLI